MNNSNFVVAIDKFAEKLDMDLDMFVRRVVFEIYVDVVTATPVDTGMLRANYQIGVNRKPSSVVKNGDKSEAITRGQSELGAVKWGTIVCISNNLPYAMLIEMGHSKQAPSGMARVAVRRMADKLSSLGGA